jgi:DNA-binding transcriptional LysR family regulator
MDRFLSIEAFVRVADCGSFAEAARQLAVAKSVITHRVQQLEEFVGAPLFHRTTRTVQLSETGQAFYSDCQELVSRTDLLAQQMRDMQGSPKGTLRVHALPGFVLGHLAKVLHGFQDRYPGVQLDLVVNDAVIDPVRDRFDCALQIFPPSSEQLVERKLFPVRRVFCAAPSYLAHHPELQVPADLLNHRLGLYSRYPTRDRWAFYPPVRGAAAGSPTVLDLPSALSTNSVHLLAEWALEGSGIVCIPTLIASSLIERGDLALVLPQYVLSSFTLSAVYPTTQRNTLKLKLFVEALFASFAGDPPWDRPLIAAGHLDARLLD